MPLHCVLTSPFGANLEFHRTLYLRAQTPAMLAMCETVWLQLGPTMRAVYARIKRREPPTHHRMILAALKAGMSRASGWRSGPT